MKQIGRKSTMENFKNNVVDKVTIIETIALTLEFICCYRHANVDVSEPFANKR